MVCNCRFDLSRVLQQGYDRVIADTANVWSARLARRQDNISWTVHGGQEVVGGSVYGWYIQWHAGDLQVI